jgi:cytochrome c oxidase subunit 2
MEETLFFVLGISLVAIALVLSALGLIFESFPPNRLALVGITGAVAAAVVATAAFAWMNAEEEQDEHAAELAAERAEAFQESAAEAQAEEAEGAPAEEAAPPEETAAVDGSAVFESAGCSGCHTLDAAGSTAETGPNLDGALKGQSKGFIEESIIDPSARVAEGFPPNVMPDDYGTQLSPEELEALVDYLAESTSGQS